MDGAEHLAGVSESQGYLCNEAENKKNTGTKPSLFLKILECIESCSKHIRGKCLCLLDTLKSLIKINNANQIQSTSVFESQTFWLKTEDNVFSY